MEVNDIPLALALAFALAFAFAGVDYQTGVD
jgi:hypothetical protein